MITRGSRVQMIDASDDFPLTEKSCSAMCFWEIRISKAANVSPNLVVDNLDYMTNYTIFVTKLYIFQIMEGPNPTSSHCPLGLGFGTLVLSGRVKCTFHWNRAYPIRRKASFPGARGGLSCTHENFSIHTIQSPPNIKSLQRDLQVKARVTFQVHEFWFLYFHEPLNYKSGRSLYLHRVPHSRTTVCVTSSHISHHVSHPISLTN